MLDNLAFIRDKGLEAFFWRREVEYVRGAEACAACTRAIGSTAKLKNPILSVKPAKRAGLRKHLKGHGRLA